MSTAYLWNTYNSSRYLHQIQGWRCIFLRLENRRPFCDSLFRHFCDFVLCLCPNDSSFRVIHRVVSVGNSIELGLNSVNPVHCNALTCSAARFRSSRCLPVRLRLPAVAVGTATGSSATLGSSIASLIVTLISTAVSTARISTKESRSSFPRVTSRHSHHCFNIALWNCTSRCKRDLRECLHYHTVILSLDSVRSKHARRLLRGQVVGAGHQCQEWI